MSGRVGRHRAGWTSAFRRGDSVTISGTDPLQELPMFYWVLSRAAFVFLLSRNPGMGQGGPRKETSLCRTLLAAFMLVYFEGRGVGTIPACCKHHVVLQSHKFRKIMFQLCPSPTSLACLLAVHRPGIVAVRSLLMLCMFWLGTHLALAAS